MALGAGLLLWIRSFKYGRCECKMVSRMLITLTPDANFGRREHEVEKAQEQVCPGHSRYKFYTNIWTYMFFAWKNASAFKNPPHTCRPLCEQSLYNGHPNTQLSAQGSCKTAILSVIQFIGTVFDILVYSIRAKMALTWNNLLQFRTNGKSICWDCVPTKRPGASTIKLFCRQICRIFRHKKAVEDFAEVVRFFFLMFYNIILQKLFFWNIRQIFFWNIRQICFNIWKKVL